MLEGSHATRPTGTGWGLNIWAARVIGDGNRILVPEVLMLWLWSVQRVCEELSFSSNLL